MRGRRTIPSGWATRSRELWSSGRAGVHRRAHSGSATRLDAGWGTLPPHYGKGPSEVPGGKEMSRASDAAAAWPHGAPAVGATARRSRTVEADDIVRFTAMSGDRNPLHYDAEAAAASRFGEIIVQGGVTSAILNAVVAEELPGPGTVFLHVEWDFRAPVRPGDTITGEVEVLEARQDKPITRLRTTVTRGDGVVALEGTALCYTVALG